MTPSLFESTDAQDEVSLNEAGTRYQKRIKKHHETFIKESDFQWLKQHNIEIIRIPIGYWTLGGDPSMADAASQLKWAFNMAKEYDIRVLISIHGAPGSQNGKKHSGRIGKASWHKNKNNREATLALVEKLCKEYGKNQVLWGIELLNEPHISIWSSYRFITFYYRAVRTIQKHTRPDVRVVISDALWPWKSFWAFWAQKLPATLDLHYYHSFGINKNKPPQEIIKSAARSHKEVEKLTRKCPVIVGEWSIVMGKDKSYYKHYANTQMKAYARSDAWFYWSYKTEAPGTWHFRDCVEKGLIKLI